MLISGLVTLLSKSVTEAMKSIIAIIVGLLLRLSQCSLHRRGLGLVADSSSHILFLTVVVVQFYAMWVVSQHLRFVIQ